MDKSAELIKTIKNAFPGLSNDVAFRITSPLDRQYNCIAWAFDLSKNRWMQFDTRPRFDGVHYWWPNGVTVGPSVFAYIEAFKTNGYEICDSCNIEKGYVKIALYVEKSTQNCLHAARQKIDGTWMSKLGPNHDIVHGTPYSLVGNAYGDVHCFMKKPRL